MAQFRRFLCIIVVFLFLCVTLSACSSADEANPESTEIVENSAALAYIKSQWQYYVIDRTEQVTQVQISLGLADSHMGLTRSEEDIRAVLDVCQTLDISKLCLLKEDEYPNTSIYGDLYISLCSDSRLDENIHIQLLKNGEAYVHMQKDGKLCWAYAGNWPVYDALYKIKYFGYLKME